MWQSDEAVEVRRGSVDGMDTPEQFLWRGRLWRVCAVLAQWTESAAWWEPVPTGPGADGPAAPGAIRAEAAGAVPASGAVAVLAGGWGPQRSVFRVEAGTGRYGRREVFDLAFDPDSGRWQLERVTGR